MSDMPSTDTREQIERLLWERMGMGGMTWEEAHRLTSLAGLLDDIRGAAGAIAALLRSPVERGTDTRERLEQALRDGHMPEECGETPLDGYGKEIVRNVLQLMGRSPAERGEGSRSWAARWKAAATVHWLAAERFKRANREYAEEIRRLESALASPPAPVEGTRDAVRRLVYALFDEGALLLDSTQEAEEVVERVLAALPVQGEREEGQ